MGNGKTTSRGVQRRETLSSACVAVEHGRCVQCGICSYNCPSGIDVRRHSWLERPVADRRCLTCGECVRRCPRGVLYFKRMLPGA